MPQKKAKKPKLSVDVTAREFAELGAEFMHRDPGGNKRDFDSRWQAHFCAEPEVCADVWAHLTLTLPIQMHQMTRLLSPAIFFGLCCCSRPMRRNLSLPVSVEAVDEDTFRKWAWHFIEKVSYLEHEVVSCFILVLA